MMSSVPGVKSECLVERHHTEFGMAESLVPITGLQGPKQQHPPLVKRLEQVKGDFYRSQLTVRQLRPTVFRVRLDCGLVFRQRQLETDIGVQVAVG